MIQSNPKIFGFRYLQSPDICVHCTGGFEDKALTNELEDHVE